MGELSLEVGKEQIGYLLSLLLPLPRSASGSADVPEKETEGRGHVSASVRAHVPLETGASWGCSHFLSETQLDYNFMSFGI